MGHAVPYFSGPLAAIVLDDLERRKAPLDGFSVPFTSPPAPAHSDQPVSGALEWSCTIIHFPSRLTNPYVARERRLLFRSPIIAS